VFWKNEGGIAATLSTGGSLIYVRGTTDSFLSALDSRGSMLSTGREAGSYWAPAWSPDGKRVAVEVHAVSNGIAGGIWIYDVASGVSSRVTSRVSAERPSWTADGRRIAFINSNDPKGSSVWSVPADGSGPEEPFYLLPGKPLREVTFSADSRYAVFRTNPGAGEAQTKLWVLPLQGERKAVPLESPFDAALPAVSPNSKWIAYESNATARTEIYVRPISGSAGIVQVSSGGGSEPRWLPDGRLAYRDGRAFRSATIGDGGGVPSVTRRDSLFADAYRLDANFNRQNYDIARDGRFIVVGNASEERDIIVVANWLTEVRAKLREK
jgi:dipeptidyl aminopeptidase/acylaminoacyl peptidase